MGHYPVIVELNNNTLDIIELVPQNITSILGALEEELNKNTPNKHIRGI